MKEIEIYTDQESNFFKGACNLLGIGVSEHEGNNGVMSCKRFLYDGRPEQLKMLAKLMRFNFEQNILQ